MLGARWICLPDGLGSSGYDTREGCAAPGTVLAQIGGGLNKRAPLPVWVRGALVFYQPMDMGMTKKKVSAGSSA